MRNKLIILLFLTFSSCSQKEDLSLIHGFSKEKLKNIDVYANDLIKKNILPGLVIMVKRGENLVFHKSFGYSDAERKIRLDKNAIFRFASITKLITSVGILKLWEEGKIDLEDPIEKYIPEFKNTNVFVELNPKDSSYIMRPTKNKITIRHLLTHTSGIGYGIHDGDQEYSDMYKDLFSKSGLVELYSTDSITQTENIKNLTKIPLLDDPGKEFHYSLSIDVLGNVIEIITQKSLKEFFNDEFFGPLEMNNTFFYLPEDKKHLLIPVLTNDNGYFTNHTDENYDSDYPIKGAKTFFSGGTGLCGTISDYSNFLTMLVNGGRFKQQQILGKKTIELMQKNQLSQKGGIEYYGKKTGHGLASGVTINSENIVNGFSRTNLSGTGDSGTLFWTGMFGTHYSANPNDGLIILVFKQYSSTEDSINVISRIILHASTE
jgi:CubicO group peptidase (beta-lactamase class C family)